jgi:hypothetical protein
MLYNIFWTLLMARTAVLGFWRGLSLAMSIKPTAEPPATQATPLIVADDRVDTVVHRAYLGGDTSRPVEIRKAPDGAVVVTSVGNDGLIDTDEARPS